MQGDDDLKAENFGHALRKTAKCDEGLVFAPYIPVLKPLEIPEEDLKITMTKVRAEPRKLKANWSMDAISDFFGRPHKIETQDDLESMRFLLKRSGLRFDIEGRWRIYEDPAHKDTSEGTIAEPNPITPDEIKIGDTIRIFGDLPSIVDVLAQLDVDDG